MPHEAKAPAAKPDGANKGDRKQAVKVEPGQKPVEPKTGTVDGRTLAERQGIYRNLVAQLEKIDADALKKFGKKPTKEDPITFSVPYKAFVDRARDKLFSDLFAKQGILRAQAEAILKEGDASAWPKK